MIQKVYKVYPKSSSQALNRVVQEPEALYAESALKALTVRGSSGQLRQPVEREGYTEFASKGGMSGAMRACRMNPSKSFRLSEKPKSRATLVEIDYLEAETRMMAHFVESYNKNGESQDIEQFVKRTLEVA